MNIVTVPSSDILSTQTFHTGFAFRSNYAKTRNSELRWLFGRFYLL